LGGYPARGRVPSTQPTQAVAYESRFRTRPDPSIALVVLTIAGGRFRKEEGCVLNSPPTLSVGANAGKEGKSAKKNKS